MFENITFANPKLLWGLLIIPAAILWYIFRHKKQEAPVRYSDTSGFDNLPRSWKVYARHLLFVLQMAVPRPHCWKGSASKPYVELPPHTAPLGMEVGPAQACAVKVVVHDLS